MENKNLKHEYIKDQQQIKMQNPNQEPPESSKASNWDIKNMDVLGTFKIKVES